MARSTGIPKEFDPKGVGYRTVFDDDLDHTPLVARIYWYGFEDNGELRFSLLDVQGITLYDSGSERGGFSEKEDIHAAIKEKFGNIDVVDERELHLSAAHHFVGKVQEWAAAVEEDRKRKLLKAAEEGKDADADATENDDDDFKELLAMTAAAAKQRAEKKAAKKKS